MKKIFLLLWLVSYATASYQKVYIGNIDPAYNDKIDYQTLKSIILEIEELFESTLKTNLFDYDEHDSQSKPIDLIYKTKNQAKKDFDQGISRLETLKRKIEKLQSTLPQQKSKLQQKSYELEKKIDDINQKIDSFNEYITQQNKIKITSKEQLLSIKKEVNTKKRKLESLHDKVKQYQMRLNNEVKSYNQKISLLNSFIKQHNRLANKIEVISRSIKEIKGAAIGYIKIQSNQYQLDGKTYTENSQTQYMDKIEIYSLESINELKVILAHELAHLIGADHVNEKGALMNPILQQSQLIQLRLKQSDIKAIQKGFK